MKKSIYLYLVFIFAFMSCSESSSSKFCFIPIHGETIEVKDFELDLGENKKSVYLFIKDDEIREKILKTSLSSVEFRTKFKLIKGKLRNPYSRKVETHNPFYFHINKKTRQIIYPLNFDGKIKFYIGDLEELAPEIKEEIMR